MRIFNVILIVSMLIGQSGPIAASTLLVAPGSTNACTISWAVDADGYWDEPSNWDPEQVPVYGDDVCIDRPAGNFTVTIQQSAGTVDSVQSAESLNIINNGYIRVRNPSTISAGLQLDGGVLATQADGTWIVSGNSEWGEGSVTGVVTNTGVLTLSGTVTRTLSNRLDNTGMIIHTGSGNLYFSSSSAKVNNLYGALYEFRDDADFSGSTSADFTNSGTLRKSSGTGESRINPVDFNNLGGTIEVQTGTVIIGASGSASTGGTFNVSEGATLDLTGGGSPDYEGTYTGSGGGLVFLAIGTLQTKGTETIFNFPDGMFQWTGGKILQGSGDPPFTNMGSLTLSGSGVKTLQSVLSNTGQIIHKDSGDLDLNDSDSTLDNQDGAVYDFQGDVGFSGSTSANFNNRGTVRKSGGTGETGINPVDFNNLGGTIEVLTGTLTIGASGSASTGGTFNVSEGAILDLTGGGSPDYEGTYTGSGGGQVLLASGTLQTKGTETIFNFPEGMFQWTGGKILQGSGDPPFTNMGSMTLSGSGVKTLQSTINNTGQIKHTGSGDLDFNDSDSTLDNQNGAVYDFQGDAGFIGSTGANFNNSGTVRKSSGAGETHIKPVDFNNLGGTIEVLTGTLTIGASGSASTGGTFTVSSGAVLDLTGGGSADYGGTYTGSGGGQVMLSSGTLDISGNGATFDFPAGMFHWTGGAFSGDSTRPLTNTGYIQISGPEDKLLYRYTVINNQGTIIQTDDNLMDHTSWAGTSFINNQTGGLFEIQGEFNPTRSVDFNNEGLFRKTGSASESAIGGTFNLLGGTVDVQDGTLNLAGGSDDSNGGTFYVNAGAEVKITRDVVSNNQFYVSGTYTGSGAGKIELTGQLTVDTPDVAMLDFPEDFFRWTGGFIYGWGELVNEGSITLAGDNDKQFRGNWTNNGEFVITGNGNLYFFSNFNFTNNGVFDIRSDADIDILYNCSGCTRNIKNVGTFRKSAGSGTSEIRDPNDYGTLLFDNTGTVDVQSGTLSFLEPVSQTVGSTLTGGSWNVESFATLDIPSAVNITTNRGNVILNGPGSGFLNLNSLEDNGGSFSILNDRDFVTAGDFSNSGQLTIGNESTLTVNGELSVEGSDTLTIEISGRPATALFGQINVSGVAHLTGTLNVDLADGFGPTLGDSYQIMSFSSQNGEFATINDLYPFFEATTTDTALILETIVSAADISVDASAIVIPASGTPGEEVSITYEAQNLSENDVLGDWNDSIYLSSDETYDPDDTLIGRILHVGGVTGLSIYSETLTAPLPGVPDGDYYVIVIADSRGLVPDINRENNTQVSTNQIQVSVTLLIFDIPVAETIDEDQDIYYRLDVPEGGDVLITANFSDVLQSEFYVSFNQIPDRSNFDYSAPDLSELQRQILLPSPEAGPYYVLLHGREGAAGGKTYDLTAEHITFALVSITPDYGGNIGEVSVQLSGAGFTSDTKINLQNATRSTIITSTVQFVDGNTVFATFDLNGVPVGVYDVTAKQDALEAVLDDAFTVVSGEGGELDARLILPGGVRGLRPFPASTEYENIGDIDLPVPLFTIEAPEGGSVWSATEGEENEDQTLQFLGIPPAGVCSDVMLPGVDNTFDYNIKVPLAGSTRFTLYSIAGDSSDPFDWELLYDGISIDSGSTAGSYVSTLTSAAVEARAFDLDLITLRDVLAYSLGRAGSRLPDAVIKGTVYLEDLDHPLARPDLIFTNIDTGETLATQAWWDGVFGLRGAPTGTYDVIVQNYAPYPAVQLTYPGPGPLEDVQITVTQGAIVEGRILDEDDKSSVEGAAVFLRNLETEVLFLARTDEDGNYRVLGLPTGKYSLTVTAADYVDGLPQTLDVEDGQTVNFRLELSPGGGISGEVHLPDDSPAPSANVRATSLADPSVGKTVQTDEDGQFTVLGLPEGEYDVVAFLSGYGNGFISSVDVTSGETVTGQVIELVEAGQISGTVTDLFSGSPIEEASVTISGLGFEPALSNGNGEYLISSATPGTTTLSAKAEGYLNLEIEINVPIGGETVVDLVLQPGGIIQGEIFDGLSNPLANMPLILRSPQYLFDTNVTDEQGQFSFEGLDNGDYTLVVGAKANSSLVQQMFTLDESANNFTTTIMFEFAILSGTVFYSDGIQTADSVRLWVFQDGEQITQLNTGEDGTFEIKMLLGGPVDIYASSEKTGIVSLPTIEYTIGETISGLDLVGGSATLEVTATNQSRAPIDAAKVAIAPVGGSGLSLIRDTETLGIAQFENLVQGDYEIEVIVDGFQYENRVISVSNGGTSIDFELVNGRTITGIVDDQGGNPLPGAIVGILEPASGQINYVVAGENGMYVADFLPSSIFDLIVSDGVNTPAILPGIDTTIGEVVTADVTLGEAGTALNGQVSDEFGEPIFGALVSVFYTDVAINGTMTDINGDFETLPLPNGVYTVEVSIPDRPVFRTVVTVTGSIEMRGFSEAKLHAQPGEGGYQIVMTPIGPLPELISDEIFGPLAPGADYLTSAPDPNVIHAGSIDTSAWRTSFMGSAECPCDGFDQAYDRSVKSMFILENAFESWEDAFKALEDIGEADLLLYAAKAADISAKTVGLVGAFGLLAGLLETAGLSAASANLLANGLSALVPLADQIGQAVLGGDADMAGAGVDALIGAFSALAEDVLFETAGSGAAGAIGAVITGIRAELGNIKQLIDQLNDDVSQNLSRYQVASNLYYDALLQHKTNMNQVFALRDCGKDSEECDPCKKEPKPDYCDPCKKVPKPKYCKKKDERGAGRFTSGDPNDIIGPEGFGPLHFVTPDETFDYTIRFENVPTATAPAQEVVITQQLSSDLDFTTFELGDFTFGDLIVRVPEGRDYYSTRLDLREELGFLVDFEAGINFNTGLASWHFISIDPDTGDLISDVLAGFLPPNVDSPEGEGLVMYSIEPKPVLTTGTQVDARATIIFDLNQPIDTPVYTNTIDADPPVSGIDPLPVTSPQTFTVSWSGTDGAGSGIFFYDVYVSIDDGVFTGWKVGVTETQAIFSGTVGSTYGFFSVATDNVGYLEETPVEAQASTTIISAPAIPILLSPPNGLITITQTITFAWQAGPGEPPDGYNFMLDGTVITTTYTTSSTFLSYGRYTWTVRAFNADGYSDWVTPAWSLEITEALPEPGIPTLISPPSGTITTTQTITFSWQTGAGTAPDGYNLKLDGIVLTTTATSTTTILSVGDYTWTVRSYNENGYSDWVTPAWTLEIVSPEPLPRLIFLPIVMKVR